MGQIKILIIDEMDMKQSTNPEPPKFERIETATGHSYKLEGKRVTGVTTILGAIGKEKLIQWAADMAGEYVEQNIVAGVTLTEQAIKKIATGAKKAYTVKRDNAADEGTIIHAIVEEYVNKCIAENNGIPIEPGTFTHENPRVESAIRGFFDWVMKTNVVFLLSEKTVFSEDDFYAGTMDLVIRYNGKLYIADIKTSKAIYDRGYFAQMAAYQNAIEEMTGKWGSIYSGFPSDEKVEGRLIIRCGKNGTFETRESLDYEKDLALFKGALQVYRNKNL